MEKIKAEEIRAERLNEKHNLNGFQSMNKS